MSSPFVPLETAVLSWRDGLPYSQHFDDIYFSQGNGLQETEYVFIRGNHLIERWQALSSSSTETFVIAETGFGSALNFLLTWSLWLAKAPKTGSLHFISCEKFPLNVHDLARCLSLWPQLQKQAQQLLASYPILTPGFHHLTFDEGRVKLTLMLGDAASCFNQLLLCGDAKLESQLRTCHVDAWFLDGFSPAKNPEMWSEDLFHAIGLLSKPGTTLSTFSAAGQVKTNLKKAGFTVDKIKGYGAKRDMIVAQFKDLSSYRCGRVTPWHVSSSRDPVKNKKAIILGAGLAGCYTAHALAKRGWLVTLIDGQNEVGCGASGNKQAILYPKFSAYSSPLTVFMLTAFLFANRVYQQILAEKKLGHLTGLLQLAFNEKEAKAQESLAQWLNAYPQLGVLVSEQQASTLAGIEIQEKGLYIPASGWLDSQALCQFLRQTKGVEWVANTEVNELIFDAGQWHAAGHTAEVLVIANGYNANQFAQTAYLPLKAIRGQMTWISSNVASEKLLVPLCGHGHILPAIDKSHALGATYHLGSKDSLPYPTDDLMNLNKLEQIPTNTSWSTDIQTSWSGVRAATTDYLPLVGLVPEVAAFNARFQTLASNANRWLALAGAYYPGLYLCAGFGSRGLTTIPLAAEWLAGMINNEISLLPRFLVQAISPARFLRKKIVREKGKPC